MTDRILLVFISLCQLPLTSCIQERNSDTRHTVPVIYSTDLSHPHDDPDDHFDIVALYALQEIDILGIILDQADLLQDAPDSVMNFFIYALLNESYPDYLNYLKNELVEERKSQVLSGQRRLWCTAVFTAAAGRIIVEREGEYIPVSEAEATSGDRRVEPFCFLPVSLFVDDNAGVVYEESSRSHAIQRFEINSPDQYGRIMTSVTRFLIRNVVSPGVRNSSAL